MEMKSLKWKGFGTKNLFPHTSSLMMVLVMVVLRLSMVGGD